MKKIGVILILALFVSIISIVHAQNISNITENITESFGNLSNNVLNKTESKLNESIEIPQGLQLPARIVFGIKQDSPISLQYFILLVAVWVIFFVVIWDILKFFPLIDGMVKNFVGSFIITTLVAMSGGLLELVSFFFQVGTFKWLSKLGPFQILVWLFILIVIFLTFRIIIEIIRRKLKLEVAEHRADSVNKLMQVSEITAKELEEEPKEEPFNYQHKMRRGGEKSERSRFVSKESTERYARRFGADAARNRFEKK